MVDNGRGEGGDAIENLSLLFEILHRFSRIRSSHLNNDKAQSISFTASLSLLLSGQPDWNVIRIGIHKIIIEQVVEVTFLLRTTFRQLIYIFSNETSTRAPLIHLSIFFYLPHTTEGSVRMAGLLRITKFVHNFCSYLNQFNCRQA